MNRRCLGDFPKEMHEALQKDPTVRAYALYYVHGFISLDVAMAMIVDAQYRMLEVYRKAELERLWRSKV